MANPYYGDEAKYLDSASWKSIGIQHGSANPFSYKRYGTCTDFCLAVALEDEGMPWTYQYLPLTPALKNGEVVELQVSDSQVATPAYFKVTVNPDNFFVLVEGANGTDVTEYYLQLYIR